MDQSLSLVLTIPPNLAEEDCLREGLTAYNDVYADSTDYVELMFSLKDGEGRVVGGISGKIYYQWLYVQLLWVEEKLRRHGKGTELLKAAEEEARRRGCRHAWLDTYSFQARGFYEKNGYVLFGELPDYPSGHQRYFLRKDLV